MIGRLEYEDTLEGILAAVAEDLRIKMLNRYYQRGGKGPKEPGFADFREAFRPWVRRGIVLAKIEYVRRHGTNMLTLSVSELATELAECEKDIPPEYRI